MNLMLLTCQKSGVIRMKYFAFLTLICQIAFHNVAFAQNQATKNLFQAIQMDNPELAQKAIAEGADLNSVNDINGPTKTVLTYAAALNRLEIAKMLIDHGANVDQVRPIDFHTALMIAATRNLPEMALLLISGGADINKTTIINRTALQIAAFNGSFQVAQILVKQKNMKVNNREKKCALFVATRQQHLDIVQLLLSLKADKAPSEKCLSSAKEMALQTKNQNLIKMFDRF